MSAMSHNWQDVGGGVSETGKGDGYDVPREAKDVVPMPGVRVNFDTLSESDRHGPGGPGGYPPPPPGEAHTY